MALKVNVSSGWCTWVTITLFGVIVSTIIVATVAPAPIFYIFGWPMSREGTQDLRALPKGISIASANNVSDEKVVIGWWKLVTSKDGAQSRGSGGACLLESLDDFGPGPHRCETEADCTTIGLPGPPGVPSPELRPEPWTAYCHPKEKSCWVRPLKRWCNRAIDYEGGPQIWDLGWHTADIGQRPKAKPQTNWRVVTCLKKYDKNGLDFPTCGDPAQSVTEWGDAQTVP